MTSSVKCELSMGSKSHRLRAFLFALLVVMSPAGLRADVPISLVADLNVGSANPGQLTVAGGQLFFHANDGVSGDELWRSDGTAPGTEMVKDIKPGAGSSAPVGLTAIGSEVFFLVDSGYPNMDLWKSDGTLVGSQLIWHFVPYKPPLLPATRPNIIGGFGGLLYLNGTQLFTIGSDLWRSDGTVAGTSDLLTGIRGAGFADIDNTLYFVGSDVTNGFEIWTTDGTIAGSHLFADINPGSEGSYSVQFTSTGGGEFIFTARDAVHGEELWRSDGTPGGTELVLDIAPGTTWSRPHSIEAIPGLALFAADDSFLGTELWRSDGTTAGTWLLKDLNPGAGGSDPDEIIAADGVFFIGAATGETGVELWRSDGNLGGTVRLAEFGVALLSEFTAVGSGIVFTACDLSGCEPWHSDGTRAGTWRLADLNPGTAGSNPEQFTELDAAIYFAADDGA